MANPISDLQALAGAPVTAARDLATIAHALQTLRESGAAVEPLPEAINTIRNVPGIEGAAASLPVLIDAVHQVPAIEALLHPLIAALAPALADVKRVREVVDSQHEQVTHIEAMVPRIECRSQVLERIVVDLQAKADGAIRVLPDPDDQEAVLGPRLAMSSPARDRGSPCATDD